MVWPVLGIVMVMLPGQINYISEALKAEQLFWPLLIAIVLGLPLPSLGIAAFVIPFMYWLHPAASPLFLAAAMAAIAMAVVNKGQRVPQTIVAGVLVTAAALRWQLTSNGGQQSEMTVDTQQRQWENATGGGSPTFLLIALAILVVTLLISAWLPRRFRPHLALGQYTVAAIGCLLLIPWALTPADWWEALEYRGPAFWITSLTAGAFVLHVLILHARKQHTQPAAVSSNLSAIICGSAALIIMLQSFAWHRTVDAFSDQLASAEQACVAREDIAGMPFTPLNLWSTLPLSLLLGGPNPEHVSMLAEECQAAIDTGEIQMFGGTQRVERDYLSTASIEQELTNATACTWVETDGWHQREALIPDVWQWSAGEASWTVNASRTGEWELRGDIRSPQADTEVEIWVNGKYHSTVNAQPSGTVIDGTIVALEHGKNLITFRTDATPTVIPSDGRELAFSLWNVSIRANDGSAPCTRLPAGEG